MPDLGEEMGDVEEERAEVIELIEDNISIFSEAIAESADVTYDADANNVRVDFDVNDNAANRIEEEFDGVNVNLHRRETFRFNLQKEP